MSATEFENVLVLLREFKEEEHDDQRDSDRFPLVRPVRIMMGDQIIDNAFSRDISLQGVGTISMAEFTPGQVAFVAVHSLEQNDVVVEAKVAWSQPYGYGWFATGWQILSDVKA